MCLRCSHRSNQENAHQFQRDFFSSQKVLLKILVTHVFLGSRRCCWRFIQKKVDLGCIFFFSNIFLIFSYRREPFHEFLRRLLEESENTDITFVVNGSHIKAHRFILAARSDYFEQELLVGRWKNRDVVTINNSLVDSSVFYRIMEWLYTGQVKFAVSQYEDALRLCKQCRLDDLEEEIQSAFIKADSFGKNT